MKKSAHFFLGLILVSFILPLLSGKVYAGDLGAMVRTDRTATSRSTGGMVCAIPQTSGTESSIQVVFPTGFTVNSNPSNWSVSTGNIPSGSVAMPGITTASAVSGQIVTFPITDLSTGTQYCFNFTSSGTLTTPSSAGTYVGILRTMNALNDVVDYHAFGISIATNDSINVTATVAANPTDFAANLALTDPSTNSTFPQSTTLTYTVTYGNLLTYPADITVEASWDLGTVQGNSSPTVSLLDYVVGSATNGYGNAAPVIDSTNRKIDWTISAIPGSTTDQTVSFKLKTNSSYTGTLPVTFTVNGRTYGPGTVTPDSTVSSTYQYVTPVTPTPTPGPTSSSSSSSTSTSATSTPTPTPTSSPSKNPVIEDIQIRTVSSSQAAILITTDKNTTIKLNYGTSIKSLYRSSVSNSFANSHLITLTGLDAATRYYYKVTVKDQNGKETNSDFYVFDTAIPSIPPQILQNSLIVTSNDVVLTDPIRPSATIPTVVIPSNTPYSFKFSVSGFEKIKSIKAMVRNSNVLGLASFQAYASNDFVEVTEISPGEYIGKLQSSLEQGTYHLIIQIQDFNGNITEQTLSTFKTVSPFRVIDTLTRKPIERAKVSFAFFNVRFKTYDPLSSDITPVKNPSYTDGDGSVASVLPTGKYRAEVTAIGYEDKTIDFEINPSSPNYPTVELKPLPFSIGTYIKYTTSTAFDILSLLRQYIHTLRTSIRFFDLIGFCIIFFMVFLSLVLTVRRLSVPIHKLPFLLIYFVERIIHKHVSTYPLHGRIATAGGEVVPGVLLYIALPNGKVLSHTNSNSDGEFYAKIREASSIKISFSKKGFKGTTIVVGKDKLDDKLEIELVQEKRPQGFGIEVAYWYITYLSGTFFESTLILTLGIELLFVLEFGTLKTLPFIIISLLNIFLWAANARATRS